MLTKKLTIVTAVLLGTLAMFGSRLIAQNDNDSFQSLLEQMPPNANYYKKSAIDEAIRGLKWQITINKKQAEIIQRITHRWQKEYNDASEREDAIRTKQLKDGLPAIKLDQALRDATVQINDVRSQFEGLMAKRRKIESDLDAKKLQLVDSLAKTRASLDSQKIKLSLANDELDNNKKIFKKGMITEQQFKRSQLALSIAQTEFETLKRSLEIAETRGNLELKSSLSNAHRELEIKQRQLDELAIQKKKLQNAIVSHSKTEAEDRRFKKQLALKMIEQSQVKLLELELSNTRHLALLELVDATRILKADKEAAEKDND